MGALTLGAVNLTLNVLVLSALSQMRRGASVNLVSITQIYDDRVSPREEGFCVSMLLIEYRSLEATDGQGASFFGYMGIAAALVFCSKFNTKSIETTQATREDSMPRIRVGLVKSLDDHKSSVKSCQKLNLSACRPRCRLRYC